jgi:hypothetical protein
LGEVKIKKEEEPDLKELRFRAFTLKKSIVETRIADFGQKRIAGALTNMLGSAA